MSIKITDEEILNLLQQQYRTIPAFECSKKPSIDDRTWLSRTIAILEKAELYLLRARFESAREEVGKKNYDEEKLINPLLDALATFELKVPYSMQGTFIPAGATWKGFASVLSLIQKQCSDILLIDPYLNDELYLKFGATINASNGLRCLSEKKLSTHNSIVAVKQAWDADPANSGTLIKHRYAPQRSLHDRLIIIDRKEAWLISQSIKDIGKRSPAYLSKADPQLASEKFAYYDNLWHNSTPFST